MTPQQCWWCALGWCASDRGIFFLVRWWGSPWDAQASPEKINGEKHSLFPAGMPHSWPREPIKQLLRPKITRLTLKLWTGCPNYVVFFLLPFLSFKGELPSLWELLSLLRKMVCWQNLPFQLDPLFHLFTVHLFRPPQNIPKAPQNLTKKTSLHTYLAVHANSVGHQSLKTFTPNYLMQGIRWDLLPFPHLQARDWVSSPRLPGKVGNLVAQSSSGLCLSQIVAQGYFCLFFNYVIWCNNTSPCL